METLIVGGDHMKQMIVSHKWIVIILCILVGIYFLWPIITDESDSVLAEGAIDGNSSISNVEQLPNKPIAYITGAVVSPGLYEYENSATYGDMVKLAGGLLPYADVESVNMAKPVNAGDHIHIVFNFHGNPEVLLRGNKININTATAKELDSLPGIGPAMAKRIEEYRSQKGPFTSVEGIKGVKGIGDGVFKKIKDKITI